MLAIIDAAFLYGKEMGTHGTCYLDQYFDKAIITEQFKRPSPLQYVLCYQ
jgi:hypothetical protein